MATLNLICVLGRVQRQTASGTKVTGDGDTSTHIVAASEWMCAAAATWRRNLYIKNLLSTQAVIHIYVYYIYACVCMCFLLATPTHHSSWASSAVGARRSWGKCNKHEIFTDIDIIIHILNICIHIKLPAQATTVAAQLTGSNSIFISDFFRFLQHTCYRQAVLSIFVLSAKHWTVRKLVVVDCSASFLVACQQ